MRIPPGFNTVTPYAAMARAIAAGATKIMDIADMPYNDRQGGLKDPSGNLWWISERLVDGPY
jgi:PhnB protein